MFDLFLENAGGKLRFIAKVVMGLTLFAALASPGPNGTAPAAR